MINPGLHIIKSSRDQVKKCMNNTFGESTQRFNKATFSKNYTSVLSLIIFHETRSENTNKYFRF